MVHFAGFLLGASLALPASAASRSGIPPIADGDSPVARQLRSWWKEGTAAGNVSDRYDNRDGGHSQLELKEFPQLRPVLEPADTSRRSRAPGGERVVTFGNSSTAQPPQYGGSVGRRLYSSAETLDLLYRQYRGNQLYVFPEHLDHDPGRNQSPGWGDLFPANTPYLVISQGSSRSDQPFLRALAWTLAAFRPATKERLVAEGLLMPTFQMLLRLAASNVGSTNLYLSGLAHPTAFDGRHVDPAKLIALAHAIEPDHLPPLALVRVVSESSGPPNLPFHVRSQGERLGDTPAAVARLWRDVAGTRRMVLSADDSLDPGQRPLTFHWVVLRGDADAITIRPLNERGSVVEATFRWSGRRPIAPGAELESSRLDLGLFVHNGTWWSPPAFVTWFASDRERRTYDAEGRPEILTYDASAPRVAAPLLTPVFDWLDARPPAAAVTAFRELAGAEFLARLRAKEPAIRAAEAVVISNQLRQTEFRAKLARANQALAEARKANPTNEPAPSASAAGERVAEAELAVRRATSLVDGADGAVARAVAEARRHSVPAQELLVGLLTGWLDDPGFGPRLAPALPGLRAAAPADRVRAVDQAFAFAETLGFRPASDATASSAPSRIRSGPETDVVLRENAALLGLLVPDGVTCQLEPYLVDAALFPRFTWTDLYRHDGAGRLIGWLRFGAGGRQQFTADGYLTVERDAADRPLRALEVRYASDSYARGNRAYLYRYDGPDDLRGQASPAP